MSMSVGQVIADSKVYALERTKAAEDALAGEDLERAMRYYLQAAHAVVDGLRGAGVLLRGQAEYLPGRDDYTYELMRDLNVYLNGKQLFPKLAEIVAALQTCVTEWRTRIKQIDGFGLPAPVAQPLIDRMPELLNRLGDWQKSLVAGASGNPADEEKRAPGITGVGYDTLLKVRSALEQGEPREEIRQIVQASEEQDSTVLAEIDGLIRDLSDTATKLAAATRVGR